MVIPVLAMWGAGVSEYAYLLSWLRLCRRFGTGNQSSLKGRNKMRRRKITPDNRATLDRYSSNLPGEPTRADGGELHFGAALIHPLGGSMYSVRRVPAWPSTYSFPQGRMLANFFFLPFDRFVFALYRFARSHTPWCGLLLPPFTVSHDLTHLGRKVREHIPLKKISHALDTRTR